MHTRWLASWALAACAAAAQAQTWPIEGRHAVHGEYRGRVELLEEVGELRVTHALALADGREELLTGTGRREGRVVRATMRPVRGMTSSLPGEEAEREGITVALAFELDADDRRWRVELRARGRTLARATGERPEAPAEPPIPPVVEFRGVPFVAAPEDGRDIHESDPRQGAIGDCYLIAALIATARTRPDAIRAMIAPRGDGTWTVTFKDVGAFWFTAPRQPRADLPFFLTDPLRDQAQPVDRRFPALSGPAGTVPAYAALADQHAEAGGEVLYELWPMLIEKAWAQHKGGWDKIAGGNPTWIFELIGGKGRGRTFGVRGMGPWEVASALDAALAAGSPVTIGVLQQGKLADELNLKYPHSYVLEGARDGGYVLYNPWGGSHPTRAITAAELIELGVEIQIAGF